MTTISTRSTYTMEKRCSTSTDHERSNRGPHRKGNLMVSIPVLIFISFAMNITFAITSLHHNLAEISSPAPPRRPVIEGQVNPINEPIPKKDTHTYALHRQSRRRMQTRPRIEPLQPSLSPNATFSACLLIKDDNEILNEWLAYHYFALKLRHLIVAVDPLSIESPSFTLQKWSTLTDLRVVEWKDADYMPPDFLQKGRPPKKDTHKTSQEFNGTLSESDLLEISRHRYRQRVFLTQCVKKHKAMGNSWVMHIDTDEYVVASKLLRQMKPDYLKIPPMDQPGSVLTLLQQVASESSSLVNYPCISMMRMIFGSVESRRDARDHLVPESFNSMAFESLRWRYHGPPYNRTVHGNPKVILDVSAIPDVYLNDLFFSIHRPITALCSRYNELRYGNFRKQPISVNHYLGSWERYSRRQDKRRSQEIYLTKANQRKGLDDGIRPWLKGFVNITGDEMARKLLGAPYLAQANSAARAN